MGGWPVVIYTAQSRSWSRDYQEQSQIVAGWRIWTRDLQISNPAPWTTRTRCLPSNALHFKYCLVWSKRTISNLQRSRWWYLRAIAYKYRESHNRKENSDFLLVSKRHFWWTIFRNILSKFQRVHSFVKSRKVRNMAQSAKMADGICPKLYIFDTPAQKEGNLPGFHIHTVCNLPFGHSSELKVILK